MRPPQPTPTMEQPHNLRTKKPRIHLAPHALKDGPINSAEARYQAAYEKMMFYQGELEKARADARGKLQNHGSASIDSLLIVGDDCLTAVLPFCDWKTLLQFGGTCKKLFQLTEMEWGFRFQKIDKSFRSGSTWLVHDEKGEINYDSTNSFCKLHTVRFEKAAAYAKKLEPKVQDHIIFGNDGDLPKCSGCSEFPSQTNVECLRATKHYGFFLRIFSQDQSNNAAAADDDDTSLLWQGFVDTKVTCDREDYVGLLLLTPGLDFNNNNILPHLKDFLQLRELFLKDEVGILSEDEEQLLLNMEPKYYQQMQEKAVGNVGFILVALNSSDEMVSLVHATSEFDYDFYVEFVFKPMREVIHGNDYTHKTHVGLGLDDDTKNPCFSVYHRSA